MAEIFKCPDGHTNLIEWAPSETERTIPCTTCYYEEWKGGGPDPSSAENDPVKGLVFTKILDPVKEEHGHRFLCVKGKGVPA